MDILNNTFLEITMESWLIALGISLGVFFFLLILKRMIENRFLKIIKRSEIDLDDFAIPLVSQTRWFALLALGLYMGSYLLSLPPDVEVWFNLVVQFALILQVGFWGTGLISFYITRGVKSKVEEDQGDDATTLDALGLFAKIVLWVVLSLIVLDNLNVEISSLVASLGIGGIAVALALQNILGDLFASLTITMDKPFSIGDFIEVGGFEGNVEDIGLKSTRIRSLSGEELIFSNADLLSSRIRNYKKLEKRRISFNFGLVYGTGVEHLKAIPQMVEEIIKPLEKVQFERAHLKTLGDYSLDYSVVYYVLVPEYASYLDIQQDINLALYDRFEKLGIEFAYPTQTVLVEQSD
jgi:small-conductance mechanosensitive channel